MGQQVCRRPRGGTTTGPGKSKKQTPKRLDDQDFVTSEDLFGDMVDAPMPPSPGPPQAGARAAPIKVQVTEPGLPSETRPRSVQGAELPADEMDALLDRISAVTPAATRVRFGEETPPFQKRTDKTRPKTKAPDAAAAPPESPIRPPRDERGEAAGALEVDALLSRLSPIEDEAATPPEPREAPEPDVDEDDELPVVASRTGTKFQAAEPRKIEGAGLDLADLAENALDDATPAPPPPPGARSKPGQWRDDAYGPYRLIDRVAVGGMAEVFKAKRSGVAGFEKVVAVKRILPHLSDNQEFVDMFVNEAKMVAGLTHPNIVPIFDLGKIEKCYYIAMEYVHGRDLRTILKRAKERGMRVPLDLCLLVVQKVCAGLEYAHRKRDDKGRPMEIVHRDVSPQNILISFEGDVKLTDFGIAKAATKASSTDKGALRGKLLYMSPEQAWGRPIDRRSDIFSLGIVLYEMITDKKPFLGASSDVSILELVRKCEIAPPRSLNPRIPETLQNVTLKALARDADERYQDASEMQRGLEWVLRERQPPAAGELARLMEVLFDRAEREEAEPHDEGPVLPDPPPSAGGATGPRKASAEPADEGGVEDESAVPDGMSLDTLLKRFGIE
jgi:serine/threonine protein kinase